MRSCLCQQKACRKCYIAASVRVHKVVEDVGLRCFQSDLSYLMSCLEVCSDQISSNRIMLLPANRPGKASPNWFKGPSVGPLEVHKDRFLAFISKVGICALRCLHSPQSPYSVRLREKSSHFPLARCCSPHAYDCLAILMLRIRLLRESPLMTL